MDSEKEKESREEESHAIDYSQPPVLELKNFSGFGFNDISLKLYPGEILGVVGVVGAGRTELATTIFGRDKVLAEVCDAGRKDITGLSTGKVLEAGLNYVPEDRHLHGLFKIADVAVNTTSALLSGEGHGEISPEQKKEKK